MEFVVTRQEAMAGELKELMLKGLLTEAEVKQIVTRRTAFESALIRLEPKKGDYLRYIEYLMALEALRRKRMKRLDLSGKGPSKADYCLVEAQFNVFERAVRRFKDDISLWVQFIEHARREKAVVLTGKLTARALQLHPNSIPLYILSAKHQMEAQTPGSARMIFQRGLRLNPQSVELWTEYLKMELAYIETLRKELRRTRDLRKQVVKRAKKKGEDVPAELREVIKEDEGLKEVMDGAIVREVLRSAVEACPHLPLFTALRRLLFNHPTPLRESLLSELQAWLNKRLPHNPQAIKLSALWWIDDNWVEGSDLVDLLHSANSKMMAAVKSEDVASAEMGGLYAQWISQSVRRVNSVPLKEYFTRSLRTLIANLPRSRICSKLLATDLQLCRLRQTQDGATTAKLVARARKYIDLFPSSSEIWISYLEAVKSAEIAEWEALWSEAREKARGNVDELCRIWLWGTPMYDDVQAQDKAYESILKASIQHPCKELHPHVLLQYIDHIYETVPSTSRQNRLQTLFSKYLPSDACYRFCFSKETHADSPSRAIITLLYERWRQIDGEEIEAALRYGAWLLRNGDGRGAKQVLDRTRAILDDEGRAVLDENWVAMMDAPDDEDLDEVEKKGEEDVVHVPPELDVGEDGSDGEGSSASESEDEESEKPVDTSEFISLNCEM
ncbi:U3 snoRNP protein [Tulasnella sp. 427]|nr:U3 snoRNP protein [Tulasnella sp. 427]